MASGRGGAFGPNRLVYGGGRDVVGHWGRVAEENRGRERRKEERRGKTFVNGKKMIVG